MTHPREEENRYSKACRLAEYGKALHASLVGRTGVPDSPADYLREWPLKLWHKVSHVMGEKTVPNTSIPVAIALLDAEYREAA